MNKEQKTGNKEQGTKNKEQRPKSEDGCVFLSREKIVLAPYSLFLTSLRLLHLSLENINFL